MAYQSKYTGLQIDDILDSVEYKQSKIEDLASIRAGAAKGATALQSYTEKYTGTVTGIKINGVVKSGSGVIDLGTIESKTLTESDIAAMGFTKNAGTYSKPSSGIPKSDLATVVQTSLGKADTALQSHQDISGKQDMLVSGTNIKTINGESILGSGDITISGGSSSGSGAYPEIVYTEDDALLGGDDSYDGYLEPNKFYIYPECKNLWITFAPEINGVANEYLFQFTSGATATTLSLPDDLKWANDSAPTIEPNKIYQVSILKGLASVLEFDNKPKVTTISFKIRNYDCIAEEGMTWEQWVSSEYNTANCSLMGNNVQRMGELIGTSYTSPVIKTDVITSDFVYQLIPQS